MRAGFVFVSVVVASLSAAACSTTVNGDGSSGSSGTPSQDGGGPAPSQDGGGPGPGPSGPTPPASTNEAPVDVGGTCAPFVACGGSLAGTYDYASGCIADVFSEAKAQCPTLDTSAAKVTVKGSLHFAGAALTRDAVVKISGSITLPATCAAGQCAAVEAGLKSSFDSVTCTGSSSCTCIVSKTEPVKNATTFTISGNTLTTADGDNYEICAQGGSLRYAGKSAGSEEGSWNLTKR